MSKTRPQRYFVPELNQEIKVETVAAGSKYVAHYPTGPERVSWSEVRDSEWEHRGEWKEIND